MVQARAEKNALHELGYKIFLDRYAQKDMKRTTLKVGDTVIVVVDSNTGQREIGTITAMDLPRVTVQLLDGTVVERDIENVDKPLETDPAQMMDRVAAGVAGVEATPELRRQWAQRFRWALDDWKFVPAGRILAAAGTDQELTYYNCMPPEQEILTAEGYKPIADVKVGEAVVTHRNRLRPVLHKFERETEEELYIIKPKKLGFDDLRVTGDHKVYVIRAEWVNKHKSRDGLRLQHEPDWIPAKHLKAGDFVAVAYNSEECPPDVLFLANYVEGYETQDGKLFKSTTRGDHGYVKAWGTHFDLNDRVEIDGDLCYLFGRWLGDGCVTHRSGTDIPSGIKIVFGLDEKAEADDLARIIEDKFGLTASVKLSSTGRWYDLWANSLPLGQFFKALLGYYSYGKRIPDQLMHLPQDLTLELLRGLFSADGYISGNKLGIVLSNHTFSVQVHQLLLRLGYMFSIRENTHRLGRVPAYRIQATANECGPLFEYFFGQPAPAFQTDVKQYLDYDGLRWLRIDEIATETYTGTVMDIEVAEDHSFVSAGVVVSNCYVIPSPHDSRGGIIETLRQMTEIMSRGGGVGINVSSLRPRSAYVKGVNGRSSGAVSWGALYSFVTGLIEQGGCFGPNERILTDKGLIPAAELADRMDAGEVFHAHTHKGLRQITYRFRNGVKPLYEVTTKRGYKVRITEDHKVAVLMDGKITTMPLKYLQQGDEILLLLEQKVIEAVGAPAHPDSHHTSPDTIDSIVPVGESDVYDFEVDEVHLLSANNIYTSNSRRGALMLILNDTHPDIFDFINSKRKAGQITNANISVGVSDRLMDAVKADADWDLVFPDTSEPDYDDVWDGDLEKWEASGRRVLHYRTVRARDLWNAIIESAWASAEPGVWFRDRYNKMSNSSYYTEGNIICTNPCGEQGLPANGVCNLGAINLAAFYDAENHDVLWDDLDETSRIATRFLDNIIDSTPYFFEANKTQQMNERRVGLNTMGIAELMVKLGIRYGSDESVEFIDKLYSFVIRAVYETSIELAQEKGPFPKCDPEKFIQSGFMQTMPEDIREGVRKHGIRNVTLTTQAPNGTIGTMVNTSTGIEPFFSWTYYRKSRLGLHEERVPIAQEWFDQHPGQTELPDFFVTAMDLSPEDHIKVQAAIQRWVDSSISKTCNVPNEYTVEQVSDLYWYMYDMGCKGGTIYRDGSRDEQVLMLKGDERAEKEIAKKPENGHVAEPQQVSTPHHVYPRPNKLSGVTVRRKTPFGNAFITMNTDDDGNPFEVFITVGKAGSDLQADADGLARMISLALRSTAPQNRIRMLELVIDQLANLGGARTVGLGPSRVSSLPDAVAGALQEHYFRQEAVKQLNLPMNGDTHLHEQEVHEPVEPVSGDASVKGADMCPECGTYSLVRAEGCRTCLNCGYSEC